MPEMRDVIARAVAAQLAAAYREAERIMREAEGAHAAAQVERERAASVHAAIDAAIARYESAAAGLQQLISEHAIAAAGWEVAAAGRDSMPPGPEPPGPTDVLPTEQPLAGPGAPVPEPTDGVDLLGIAPAVEAADAGSSADPRPTPFGVAPRLQGSIRTDHGLNPGTATLGSGMAASTGVVPLQYRWLAELVSVVTIVVMLLVLAGLVV